MTLRCWGGWCSRGNHWRRKGGTWKTRSRCCHSRYRTTVLCLQEVQEDHYRKEVQRSLSAMGYSCHYKRRTGRKTDGCCTCYKTQRFMLLCQSHVEFFRPGIDQLNRDNVGLVLLLQPLPTAGLPDGRSFPPLCVANTHLLYNPRRGDIKLAQLALFLAEIDKVARTPEGSHCPIILCGDLNATPDSPLYRLLRYGSLNCRDLPAWKVSGQEKYCSYPYPRILPSPLWPDFLGVTDHCRYSSLHVPKGSGHAAAERLSYTRQRLLQLRYCLAACQRPPNLALIKGVTDNEPDPHRVRDHGLNVDPVKPPRESDPVLHVAPTEPPRDPVLHVAPAEPPRESDPVLHVAPTEPPCESDPGLHVAPTEPPRDPVLHVAPAEPPRESDPVLHVAPTEPPRDPVLHVDPAEPPRDPVLHVAPAEPPRESDPVLHVAPTEPPRDPVLHVDPAEPPRDPVLHMAPTEPPREPGLHVAPTEPPCESDPGLHVAPTEPPCESDPGLHADPVEPPRESGPVLHVAPTEPPHERDPVLHVASRDPPRQRDRGLHVDPTDPPLLRSPLSLQHDLHLTSVYSHFLPAKRHAEVTTLPMGRGASVDYIFYSAEPLLEGSTSHGVRFYEDKQLKLMGRLSLLSEADLWAAQGLPNPFCSSDHLCLLASFSLDLSAP
ncbi:protein angel homolog 1 isoform X2 [Ascaphus truei]|uniref:protein angel homolog 1 isoform X2 n=1 Tax=Ascaphus truei TaxID=8439 RepID=UPI003F5AC553